MRVAVPLRLAGGRIDETRPPARSLNLLPVYLNGKRNRLGRIIQFNGLQPIAARVTVRPQEQRLCSDWGRVSDLHRADHCARSRVQQLHAGNTAIAEQRLIEIDAGCLVT